MERFLRLDRAATLCRTYYRVNTRIKLTIDRWNTRVYNIKALTNYRFYSPDGKGGATAQGTDFIEERDKSMPTYSEDYYTQTKVKNKRRIRIQDRRTRDTEDYTYEKPVKRLRNKTIRYYDEGYYG